MKKILAPLAIALLPGFFLLTARADVTLPALFSDHMVLQADVAVPVWGWADPGEKVSVTLGDQTKTATTNASGKWALKLDKLKSAEPATLVVKGKNTVTVNDVLIGEVWLCSGQSNMEFGVGGQERADAANFPKLRVFTEKSPGEAQPAEKCQGEWVICSPETVKQFSGTAYFFGKNLHEKLGQPVGLIVSAVGGTPIESWMAREILRGMPELKSEFEKMEAQAGGYDPAKAKADYEKRLAEFEATVAQLKAEGKPLPKLKQTPRLQPDPRATRLGNLFNGKIAPLVPYAIRGAIWYQGESNSSTPQTGQLYAKEFPALIKSWRTLWGQGDFPFAWVQLPKFQDERFQGWREVRESQLKTLSLPNTGMVVMIDSGDPAAIHPKNKSEVGLRLASWALAKVYGQDIPYSGPLPAGHQVKDGAIICSFQHAEGLKSADGELKGFVIAGADRKWVPATAKVSGETVIVSSPEVKQPVAVRYAWENVPDCNLGNGAGLPASPFRTDDWNDGVATVVSGENPATSQK